MKYLIVLSIIFFVVVSYAQSTTYSGKEVEMVHYVNNGLAYAMKYDSLKMVKHVIDSCWKFLQDYPHSFARPNVFSYLLKLTVLLTNDTNKINPLIDSVLYFDKLPVTKEDIGAILIERNIDVKRGRNFVIEALPDLSVTYHIFRAYMLLARSEVTLGHLTSAEVNFKKALQIDSTRAEAWYEYLNFLRVRELSEKAEEVMKKIKKLEKKSALNYSYQTKSSPNINKNVYKIELSDLDSNSVKLGDFKGKVIVIDNFNFWCNYCVMEFPTLQKLMKEYPEVKFIFVDSFDTKDELENRYFKKKEFKFLKNQTVLFETRMFYKNIYCNGVPHTLVIDKNGNVRYDYLGFRNELETLLRHNLTLLNKE